MGGEGRAGALPQDPRGGEGMGDRSEGRRGRDVERQGMGRKGREWKGCVTLIFS
jgi:hypothetical protein